MNAQSVTLLPQSSVKSSYNVLVDYQTAGKAKTGKVKARVLGWPECQAEANTKEEALQALYQIVTEQLRDREIVSFEVEVSQPQKEHPWMQFAGMFKDNPLFEEVLEHIATSRKELDEEVRNSPLSPPDSSGSLKKP
ncbi:MULTISPECIES: hypothetical protein [Spirulina sp. CCY15215]|uniref:hypothetical protein n=1 Tax=Spirulina sp. CCY15215 TaxID=2767591 RepID=UPI0019527FB4|nr:hypothetical protein [Spirulina major]